jgi:hypothetical protein
MCGLVGFITDEQTIGLKDRVKYMRQALIIDTLRGEDSTGIFTVPHDNPPHEGSQELYATADWCKQVGDGYSFTNSENYQERMDMAHTLKFCIGHNRAATQGVVNADNAHPFQEGPITMVHNGTLRDDTAMPFSMDDMKVEVDSHAICHNLAQHPDTVAGVQQVVAGLDGAFVLIWHDARDDSLNIVRNNERPFHLVQHRYNKTIFFASEAEMLALLVARLKLTCYDEALFPVAGQYMKFKGGDILAPESHNLKLHVPAYDAWGVGNDWQGTEVKKHLPAVTKRSMVKPKILMNGTLTTVPPVITAELTRRGYDLDDQYQFIFGGKRPATNRTQNENIKPFTIYGKMGGSDLKIRIDDCCIYNKLDEQRPWCVRPIAMSYQADGSELLLCKVLRYSWMESDYRCVMLDKMQEEEDQRATALPAHDKPFCIGENTYGSETLWRDAVSGGCDECAQIPPIVDEPFLEWNDETYVCYECQHRVLTTEGLSI